MRCYLGGWLLKRLERNDIIDSDILCTSSVPTDKGKDICEGDSSGPVFDREGTLAGVVVSWGYGHARENLLGVYSRLSGTKDSIDVTIRELPSSHPASCGGRLTELVVE